MEDSVQTSMMKNKRIVPVGQGPFILYFLMNLNFYFNHLCIHVVFTQNYALNVDFTTVWCDST